MSEEHTDIVEIDALAGEEWDREQHTPVQVESNLAELVKKSGLDEGWDAPAAAKEDPTAAPRTTTNTLRRTGSAPAMPSKVHKTMAMPTVAAIKPAAPAQPKAKLEAKTAPAKPATKTTATRAALAKPAAAAPTVSPFGGAPAPAAAKRDATPVKVETIKSAPVAAKRDATPAKVETMKSAPVAVRRDATPAKVETIKAAPIAAKPPATPAKVAATSEAAAAPRAPSALELPAWPPKLPRAITNDQGNLDVALLAAGAQQAAQYDDWDEVGGATSVGNRERTQPPRKPGEDSVIVDLNAVSKTEHQPSRRPQTYPILTSDQGTTTSGAFVMPTAEDPVAAQAVAAQAVAPQPTHRSEKPTSPSMPAVAAAASSASTGASVANGSGGVSSTAWHTPLPLAAPPPEPAPQWPSAAGLDYNGAHGSAPEIPLPVTRPDPTEPHLARRTLLATVFPTPTSRKRGLLAAAGAVAVILVIVLVSAGGSAKPVTATTGPTSNRATPGATSTQSATPATPTTPTTSHAATPSQAAAATIATADIAPTSSPTTTPSQPAPKKPVVAKRRISRGKKPVVVDYDKKPDPTPEQDEALSHARTDYAAGNQHLFAGETDAAISSYRQALAAYPNYVAGYRGLGLAYAQQGNKASALLAFKTYVKLAPTAKDVALIEKRIRNLSLN